MAALAFVVVSVLFFVFFDFGNLALGFGFIPGLSHIRHLSLLGTPLSICVALLAGFGIDSFERASGGQRSWIGMLLCLLVALAVVSGWMFNASAQTHSLGFVANLLALLLLGVFFADPRVVQKAPVVATSALLVLSVAGVFWHPQVHLHAVTDASLRSQRWRSVEDALDRIKAVTPDPGRVAIEKLSLVR
ncbi:hypothetical protein HI113_43925, partial [Corallococcus exiguus]|uniref:hypothetical protein n=1 Tax=Corallococcus exiguus TaxID=83462 RepID=UPI001474AA03